MREGPVRRVLTRARGMVGSRAGGKLARNQSNACRGNCAAVPLWMREALQSAMGSAGSSERLHSMGGSVRMGACGEIRMRESVTRGEASL